MDGNPKNILSELEQALTGSARCLELARHERERIDAALTASSGATEAELRVLEHAREGREQLEAQERVVPPPPESILVFQASPGPLDGVEDLQEAYAVAIS